VTPAGRPYRLALAGIVFVALWLRLLYVWEQHADLLFTYPVVDEERYVQMGRELAMGYTEPRAWFHPPGIVYALSLVFRVFGDGLTAPRVVQAIVSSVSCLGVFAVARRMFSERIAIGAALVCALHGVLVFESCELLPPTWILASCVLALWLLSIAGERRTVPHALAAGVSLGLAAVFAPTVLPFAAIAAVWLRRWQLALALVAGAALPIAPVTIGNWERGHELVLISSNGGINFYLGNNADYDATLAMRPGHRWEALMDEPIEAGARGPAAASRYFTGKALAFFRDHPARAAGLFAHKLYLYFDGVELPRDTDLYAARDQSPLLRAMVSRGPPWLPDGLLVPLAFVGAWAGWRERRRAALAYAFVASQAVVIAAFFVTSRYRAPALPVLAMFACAGVETISAALRSSRSGWGRARPLVASFALVVIFNVPTRESRVSYAAELDFYRGLASIRHERDVPDGIAYLQRASARDPSDPRIWFELGNALDAAHRTDEAIEAWRVAGAADPWDGRARRQAADALVARGDLDGAARILRTHIAAARREPAYYAPDHLQLAFVEARLRAFDAAAGDLREATTLDPRFVRSRIEDLTHALLGDPAVDDAGFLAVLADVAGALGRRDLVGEVSARSTP
jgi:4-amino-4-deoxy-L-arabinose transferase-like glycosyltransferase